MEVPTIETYAEWFTALIREFGTIQPELHGRFIVHNANKIDTGNPNIWEWENDRDTCFRIRLLYSFDETILDANIGYNEVAAELTNAIRNWLAGRRIVITKIGSEARKEAWQQIRDAWAYGFIA